MNVALPWVGSSAAAPRLPGLREAVEIGGLYYPESLIPSALARYSVALFYRTHFPGCEVALRGSGTPLRIGERYLLFCTRHQVDDIYKDVSLWIPRTTDYVTSESFSKNYPLDGLMTSDEMDLCSLQFTAPVRQHPKLAKVFFQIGGPRALEDYKDVICMYCCGHPFVDQIFDVYDRNAIELRHRIVVLHSPIVTSDAALSRAQRFTPFEFDPNGMSGGPVFAVCEGIAGLEIRFAGVVCRAGHDVVHFINGAAVNRFIDWWSKSEGDNRLDPKSEL